MKTFFVLFKKQQGETTNAYSLVDAKTFPTVPPAIILKSVEAEEKLYSTEELEAMRDKLLV